MIKKALIFDLDGTLLDTLDDIADSVNSVLQEFGMPTHHRGQFKHFIGNGIEVLCRRTLPQDISENDFQVFHHKIREAYRAMQNTRSKPYQGIIDLLQTLNSRGHRLAVLSNKPHDFVPDTLNKYFPNIDFEIAYGARQDVPRKPAPDGVFDILQELKLNPDECYFVGDTSTDIQTGFNAGIETIGVCGALEQRKNCYPQGQILLCKNLRKF